MATLQEVIENALVLYNDGSENEEYRRGQEELANHIYEYFLGIERKN
jgi:hypothetical protein